MKINSTYKALFFLLLLTVQHGSTFANEKVHVSQDHPEDTVGGTITVEDTMALDEHAEKHEFQAEVGRLMDIIINSLYSQKEIFLREIISNASDALDKIRFMSVSNPSILGEYPELEIRVEYDSDKHTLSVFDSGIGMTKQDLINNLGTVAKSGSTNFIEAAKGGNLNLIGQFGVGFYSTFLAGSRVQVFSKHNDDKQYIWESSAAHTFSVVEDPRGNTLKRGTKVVIHLKQDSFEFAEEDRIKKLVQKYSEFINFPIYLRTQKEVTRTVEEEVPDEEAKTEEASEKTEAEKEAESEKEKEKKSDDLEVSEESEDKPKEKKTVKRTIKEKVWEWVLVNDAKAIWLRNKEEIDDAEYNKFYKALTKDYDDPLEHIHFRVEGEVDFRSILFIPKRAPYDMFENYHGKSAALKLYVRRVLINEEFEELMPKYLNFVKGVVDSDELPLNVSRETLQQLKMMKVISRKLVRKAIEMIKKIADTEEDEEGGEDEDEDEEAEKGTPEEEEDEEESEEEDKDKKEDRKQKKIQKYNDFWKEFGKNIKLGVIEDPGNRSKLAKLTRWFSSRNMTQLTSFDEYIGRSKPGQDYIYFIAGEDKQTMLDSPIIQNLLKKGYEVLLLDDPIDEYCFQHLQEYEKKKLMNVAKGEFRFPDDDDTGRKRVKKLKKIFAPLTDWWRKLLSEQIEQVLISQRLVDDPCVVVSTEHGTSANLERISKSQAYSNKDKTQMQQGKKILEINPSHPIIKELLDRVKDNPEDQETTELATMLTDTALINSGFGIADPNVFARRFYKMFNGVMGLEKNAPIEEFDISTAEDDEEEEKKKSEDDEEDEDDVKDTKSKDEL